VRFRELSAPLDILLHGAKTWLLRGRATAEMGRPPLLGLVQRRDKTDQDAPAAQVSLEVLENVRTATIKPIIVAKVKGGAQFFTDEYNIYHFTKADYDHRTVNQAQTQQVCYQGQ